MASPFPEVTSGLTRNSDSVTNGAHCFRALGFEASLFPQRGFTAFGWCFLVSSPLTDANTARNTALICRVVSSRPAPRREKPNNDADDPVLGS